MYTIINYFIRKPQITLSAVLTMSIHLEYSRNASIYASVVPYTTLLRQKWNKQSNGSATRKHPVQMGNGIHAILLKRTPEELYHKLSELFTRCLQMGYHPHHWKEGNTVMIPCRAFEQPDFFFKFYWTGQELLCLSHSTHSVSLSPITMFANHRHIRNGLHTGHHMHPQQNRHNVRFKNTEQNNIGSRVTRIRKHVYTYCTKVQGGAPKGWDFFLLSWPHSLINSNETLRQWRYVYRICCPKISRSSLIGLIVSGSPYVNTRFRAPLGGSLCQKKNSSSGLKSFHNIAGDVRTSHAKFGANMKFPSAELGAQSS